MIESGTTTYADMYYFEEEIATATREAGLRGVLGQTIIQFPVADAKTPAEGLARAEAFIKAFRDDSLIMPAVAPHAMYTLDARDAQGLRGARRGGTSVPVLIHLAETEDEVQNRPRAASGCRRRRTSNRSASGARHAGRARRLGRPTTTSQILKRRAGRRLAQPREQHEARERRPRRSSSTSRPAFALGLGTDGAASNNDLDMFEAMRQAAFLAKHASRDPTAVPAQAALDLATIGGARALGMERPIGSLEPGKTRGPDHGVDGRARQTPVYDPVSHLVYVTRGDDVRTTIVNGKVLMKDGQLRTLDRAAVIRDGQCRWRESVAGGGASAATVDDADVREVAILFGVVEAVADDEPILDREADVLDLDVDLAPRGLAEEAGRAQRLRAARPQDVLQVGERQAGVDDVFDDDDVAAVERRVEVLQQPDLAGRRRALGVARHRHEVERDVAVHVAHEIRQEHERALEHRDKMQAVGEVAADLGGQLGDPRLNLRFGQSRTSRRSAAMARIIPQ